MSNKYNNPKLDRIMDSAVSISQPLQSENLNRFVKEVFMNSLELHMNLVHEEIANSENAIYIRN